MKETSGYPGSIRQAVILAGGKGMRLRPLTENIPKPLAPVNGVPFLDYLIQTLVDIGIEEVVLLAGYKHEALIERYGSWINGKVYVRYSVGEVEDATGRRVLNAYEMLDSHFLLLYGDNYWPIEIKEMLSLCREKNPGVMTTVFSNKEGTGEYGKENNVEVGPDARVVRYDKKRSWPKLNGVDMGYFLVKKSSLDARCPGNVSFEEDLLPAYIRKNELCAYVTDTQYYYITDMPSLRRFEDYARQNQIKHIDIGGR